MVIIDAHSDYALYMYREHLKGKKNILKEQHLPFLRRGGINIEVLTVGGDFELFPEFDAQEYNIIIKIIDLIKNEIQDNSNLFDLIKNSQDFENLQIDDRIGYIMALEGSSSIGSDISLLHKYYNLGVRSFALTHNKKNLLADGCAVKSAKGLTKLGKKYVEELNYLNVAIDLSHISQPSFWDVLNIIDKPLVATHSNVKSLCNHPRNLTDEQINAIAERNGVIGINFFSLFIDNKGKNATVDRLIDHIDHIVELVGINHVGLGPDFLNYYIEDLESLNEQLDDPFEDVLNNGANFEVISDVTEFPSLIEYLKERGYSDREVGKIQGENFLRVFKEVIK
ncbi:MAG: dipeptidase [Candidatus Thorarchaeota archaeon]